VSVPGETARLDIALPEPLAPFAQYCPIRRDGNLIYLSGQVAAVNGQLPVRGRAGAELTLEQAQRAARQCALNALALLRSELGHLDRVAALLKVTVYVSTAPDFLDHHLVADGASSTFVEVLGEAGKHARSAVGAARLPMDSPVEVELTALVRGPAGQPDQRS
jgi:enamine deaminase RidA (YjgF/YER057c/UK114 family)